MVSSGTVNNDLASLGNSLTGYDSRVQEFSTFWQGDSCDNLVNQAKSFLSKFKAVIEKQLQAFASAVASYQEYKEWKNKLQAAQAALASLEEDSPSRANYYSIISEAQAKMDELREVINGKLGEASSPVLTATAIGAKTATSTETAQTSEHLNIYQGIRRGSRALTNEATVEGYAPNSPEAVKKALSTAFEIAQDDTHGYSQKTRYGNPNYDCSSFVITCWESAGTGVKSEHKAKTTWNMKKAFLESGYFEWIPGTQTVETLQPGDVLLNQKQHTEMYIGNGMMVGAHGDMDGANGDGNGREIGVCPYSGKWEGVLRYKGDANNLTFKI